MGLRFAAEYNEETKLWEAVSYVDTPTGTTARNFIKEFMTQAGAEGFASRMCREMDGEMTRPGDVIHET